MAAMTPAVESGARRSEQAASSAGAAERALAHLREMLIGGRVAPGEAVSLRTLARALGLSVTPVRSAVNRLAAEGALIVLPNRAVRVPVLSAETFREITTLRLLLEGYAAERAAELITRKELQAIMRAELAFRREYEADRPDCDRAVQLNRLLHFTLYRAARMPSLTAIIEGLWLRIGPVLNLDMRLDPRRLRSGTAVRAHARLVSALAARDPKRARAALAADIRAAARRVERLGLLDGHASRD